MSISQPLGARCPHRGGQMGIAKPVLACLLAWSALGSLGARMDPISRPQRLRGVRGRRHSRTWDDKRLPVESEIAGHGPLVARRLGQSRLRHLGQRRRRHAIRFLPQCRRRKPGLEAEFAGKLYPKNVLNSFAAATPALDKDHIYLAWTTPEEYSIVALGSTDRQRRLAAEPWAVYRTTRLRGVAHRVRRHADRAQRPGWRKLGDRAGLYDGQNALDRPAPQPRKLPIPRRSSICGRVGRPS